MPITLRVRDVMDRNVHFLDEDNTAMDAVKVMLDKNVWSVVITRNDLPVGVVTERDIFRRVISKDLDIKRAKLGDIMSSPIITISPDVSIGEAMSKMIEKGIRRLYVVEGGKIIGRVTQTGCFEQVLNVMLTLSSLPYQL